MNDFNYRRRRTRRVDVGRVPLGGDMPIRIQSMTSTSTLDVEGSVAQCERIFDAGADYVRLTAQGTREADSIGEIRRRLHSEGYCNPLVADIHFNPKAAFAAARQTDKVRINPGNFADAARTFKKIEYTEDEYAEELERIRELTVPFINVCKENGTAVRLGVNHGSLSDRIMSRYGDTPAGMVESAMEYLRIFRDEDFNDVVISIKASNTVIMVQTVRLLVESMDKEGMNYPLHLGVTEAGDGEDGRIKSAVGIGTLLAEGIGDTIRVSLSEDPEFEIPVARKLVEYITSRAGHPHIEGTVSKGYDRIRPERRVTRKVGIVGGDNAPVVVSDLDETLFDGCEVKPDIYVDRLNAVEADASASAEELVKILEPDDIILLTSTHQNRTGEIQAFIHALTDLGCKNPIIARLHYDDSDEEDLQVKCGADFGLLLLNGMIDGLMVDAPALADRRKAVDYSFGILQATRTRITKTEYISCPSCGRTLYDLQQAIREIKHATSHLKGLKIGIMGCIVNGPGEMADADYGYVGAGVGKVSLYKGKVCVERNVDQKEALNRLVAIIKSNGDWMEPE